MKREELDRYLGRKVIVTLFDGYMAQGILCKTGEEEYKDNPNLYLPKKYYFLLKRKGSHSCADSVLFRLSHVRKLEKIN